MNHKLMRGYFAFVLLSLIVFATVTMMIDAITIRDCLFIYAIVWGALYVGSKNDA